MNEELQAHRRWRNIPMKRELLLIKSTIASLIASIHSRFSDFFANTNSWVLTGLASQNEYWNSGELDKKARKDTYFQGACPQPKHAPRELFYLVD